jgi:hypothetical protein
MYLTCITSTDVYKKYQARILMSGHNKGLPVRMTKVEGSSHRDIISQSLS